MTESAPASLRVAEELVEKCAEAACNASGGVWAFCDSKSEWRAAATAIITLAQDAARREDAEWCEAQWPFSSKPYPEWYPYYLSIAAHLRAMMVKP